MISRQWGSSETGSGIFQLCHQSGSAPAGARKTIPESSSLQDWFVEPRFGCHQHKESRPNRDLISPSRGSSRSSYTDGFVLCVGFLRLPPQERIPTLSCSHKTLRRGTAEPLNAALARLGLSTPTANGQLMASPSHAVLHSHPKERPSQRAACPGHGREGRASLPGPAGRSREAPAPGTPARPRQRAESGPQSQSLRVPPLPAAAPPSQAGRTQRGRGVP